MSAPREVEVVITPTVDEYKALFVDLRLLRQNGAESHTPSILAAVRREADRYRQPTRHLRAA